MSTPADTAIGHATIPTTTSTVEAAPEVLLTRGCPKRSLAAVEAEFVDNNDIDGSAPTSSVLQSDYLIIDDDDNLNNKVEMAPEVILTTQPPHPPLFKRTRYSSEHQLTASDYALLQPIIQPDSKRELGHQHNHGGHDHSSRTHPFTRKRSMADLIHASNHDAVVCFDEPEATAIYGEPMDSGSATLGMDVIGEEEQEHEQEDVALATKYPGSTKTSTTKASNAPSPFKDLGSDPMSTGRDNGKDRKNSISQIPATNRNSSSIFMPTSHAHTRPHLRRNSSTNSKKEPPRPVRIQLLDQAESEMIMQKAQQNASPSSSSWDQDSQPSHDQDQDLRKGDDAEIALPREDPIVHDWDEEELQDEDSECDSISFVAEPDQLQAPSLAPMSTRRQSIVDSIRGDVDRNSEGKSLAREGVRDTDNDNGDDEDDEDDDKDSLRDPEREVAMMSEDQEADLHNTHLRWENQREFQDAAGLDLGEDDSQAINEDGRYGGAIEDDDEGEDYWENR
ncbi:hypothetical protein BG011_000470 [Mortierella polycephala]|uniref:Uncharacterized protein n=1 Tax=Mortierella polycephala TaxID=41804 RepID=A0A9P6UAS1_9FUNG|nr:hypothetical protein BG011_000470 [Mortierella polycephala]